MGRRVNRIAKFIDRYIVSIGCAILGMFVRKAKTLDVKDPKRILVIKLWAMGDSINTLPLIKKIKEEYPKAKIDVLATSSNMKVYEGQDFIDEINSLGIGSIFGRGYDLVVDFEPYLNISALLAFFLGKRRAGFEGRTRSTLYNATGRFFRDRHITVSYLSILKTFMKATPDIRLIGVRYSNSAEKRVSSIMKKMNITRPIIGFNPGVGTEVKEREWKGFAELAERIAKNDKEADIILIGTEEDSKEYADIKGANPHIHNLAGLLSMEELFCLLGKIDVFVSNDTGPMHLSAAQGTRTIGLFGPNTPKIWSPLGQNNIAIFHPKKGCPFLDNTSHNLVPRHLTHEQKTCMDAISVDEVYDATMKMMRR